MAYRRTEAIEFKLEQNRRRILDSARQLMAEGGFRAAQMASVAARAGIATGTVYRYFPSKTDLFTELFRQAVQREVDVIADIAAGSGPAVARLDAAIRGFCRRALLNPGLAYALMAEPVDTAIEVERQHYRRAYAAIFAELIREGQVRGELAAQNPEVSAACLVGALAEALVGPLAPDSRELSGGADSIIDCIAQFALRAIR